jgi:bifunctional non-homologous end joining protein LigD
MGRTKPDARKPNKSARLTPYEAKRNFDVTPEPPPRERSSQGREPAGKKTAAAAGAHDRRAESVDEPEAQAGRPAREAIRAAPRLAFVVQRHDARRLHYDVRLEIEGAMASWAVPKGPSYDPTVKRLAVRVEDHPMEYNAFEGQIPKGEYGAGDVLLWDRGTYETVPPGQERTMLDKGHLHVRLFGDKLVGDWHLVRTGGQGSRATTRAGSGAGETSQWLLIKAQDARANRAYDVLADRPESVVSGRHAMRGPTAPTGPSGSSAEQRKRARALRDLVDEPMLATAATSIADPDQWLFELKYDGYRLLACKSGGEARLYTRRANDWTDQFAAVAQAIARLPVGECVVDGEVCAVDREGKPSFHALQEWLGGTRPDVGVGYAVFDLLWLDGRDLRRQPIEARREALAKLLEGQGAPLSFSRNAEGDVVQLLSAARDAGLEGLVAKRKGSTYASGRSPQWLKLRLVRRQDCVVIGYSPMTGHEKVMGALVLAVVQDGKFIYAGRVGTGFTDRERSEWAKALDAQRIDKPRAAGVPTMKGARWVEPKTVIECAFMLWTVEGTMRDPRFVGTREDKTPIECVKEEDGDERAIEAPPPSSSQAPSSRAFPPTTDDAASPRSVSSAPARPSPPSRRGGPALANPDKVLFPRDGITKRDIWDYYTSIAPVLLPHLAGRPLTMQRYPDGIDGEEWYQQNAPQKTPPFVHRVNVGPRHGNKERIVCDSLDTLQWLANLAALTLHQWSCHVPPEATTDAQIDRAIARPDYVVLDLDPGDGPWAHLIETALAVHTLLDALHLESFVKTSGKRGLHVVVPIAPGPTHAEATGFAEQVARAVAKVLPEVATVERMKDKRGGKLYVDYGQNGEGRTVVSPYTLRARDGAVVSTPLAWDEVTEDLDPTRFTLRTVPERLGRRGDLFAGVLASRQRLPR